MSDVRMGEQLWYVGNGLEKVWCVVLTVLVDENDTFYEIDLPSEGITKWVDRSELEKNEENV